MEFHIMLQINLFNQIIHKKTDDIKHKIQGTKFNVEIMDEDKKIALKEGYKIMTAHLDQESERHTQEYGAPNETQVNWSNEK